MPCQLKLPIGPDGPRWDAAVELSNAHGLAPHPLDEPEPRFLEFIQHQTDLVLQRRVDTSLDVNSDVYDPLFDDCNVEDYYNSWQVLFAAEVADAGVDMRIDLIDPDVAHATIETLRQGRMPDGFSYSINLSSVRATPKASPAGASSCCPPSCSTSKGRWCKKASTA